jgi:hypothetical protein
LSELCNISEGMPAVPNSLPRSPNQQFQPFAREGIRFP